MRTIVLFVIGFAVLAVTCAAPKNSNGDATNDQNQTPAKQPQAAGATQKAPPKKPANQKQPQAAQPKRSNSAGASAAVTIDIPKPEDLETDSDPIAIGKAIAELPEDQRKSSLDKLKKLAKDNAGIIEGDFYKAAYNAVTVPDRANKFWQKQLKAAQDDVAKRADGTFDPLSLFGDGLPLSDITEYIENNPIAVAIQGGKAVALKGLGEGFKGLARTSDVAHTTLGAAVSAGQAITRPLDSIPIFGSFKRAFDRSLSNGIENSKYIHGNIYDAASKSFSEVGDRELQRYDTQVRKLSSFRR